MSANTHFNISLDHKLGISGNLNYRKKDLNESKSHTYQMTTYVEGGVQ